MDSDPINQFFPDGEDVENLLYTTLNLEPTASSADITKAYRRLALVHHPDKHSSASDEKKQAEALKFQQVGYAYAVLKDETRRKRYDTTGRTNEGDFLTQGEEMGWEAYFAEVFDVVDRASLDEMKKSYQESSEERTDLLEAYRSSSGSLPTIMDHIPHSTFVDEARFISLINQAIKKGDIERTDLWVSSSGDKKASRQRKKEAEKEASEAEQHAKDIGVWDEFYGSGERKEKDNKGKAKRKASTTSGNNEEESSDLDALRALILKKNANRANDLIASLEAKYAPGGSADKAKKAKKGSKGKKEEIDEAEEEEEQTEQAQSRPTKRARAGTVSSKNKGRKT
ncbi:Molecular chaperone (DnaJ superfamily) [Phaffia rhodozyma]|uniref:Molecular chaperone (DnaJ superfamily) n=1 Tax=Phaffia rhodozyma TaxID=264483 RepID=A0A0F7SRC8_PHARH|nr:Molecular chaperone (DnaJ superfamily) [Phaffia rhodozyma]